VAFNLKTLYRPQWISFETDDVFNPVHFIPQKLHLSVCCDNTILRNGPSSFTAPCTVRDQSDLPAVLMYHDMASYNVLHLSAAAAFTSRLISDFRTWASYYFFLKDNWMEKINAYYQFRPTAKITLIPKCFSVTRFDKKK
jgi:hypothetical protein